MFDCDPDAAAGGGDGDGDDECALVSLVLSSGAARPLLEDFLQPFSPEPGLKEGPGLTGCPWSSSSWWLLTFCFYSHSEIKHRKFDFNPP